MHYLLTLLLLLVLAGCAPKNTMYQERVLVQANTEDLSKLVWDYTIQLEHEKRLRLQNNYVAAADNESFIRFEFTSQAIMEVGPARQLLVDVTEGFLSKLNNSAVAKELLPYPFDAEHMEIYIYLESFHGEYVDPFFVGWIVLERGMAYYYAFDLQNRELDYWHSRIEPYAKSRSYVEFERAAERHYEQTHPKPASRLSEERFQRFAGSHEPGAAGQSAVLGQSTVVADRGFTERREESAAIIPDQRFDNTPARTLRAPEPPKPETKP